MIPASIPSPPFSSFHLGPVEIHVYALTLLTGMAAAWWLGQRRWRARGGLGETFESIVLWAIPCGILGARIYHVATHWEDYVGPGRNPWSMLFIWEGGIAIFGGLIGGALGALVACRLYRARITAFADALAPGLILAQAIGRLGNWFNQELFGGPDDSILGLEIAPQYRPAEYSDVETFQPTFLYEMTWNLAGMVLLLWLDRRFRLGYGRLFALYLMVYGTGRFFIEGIRTDFSYYVGPLRTNQLAALAVFALGAAYLAWATRRLPVREPWVEARGIGGPESGALPGADADAATGAAAAETPGLREPRSRGQADPSP